MRLRNLGVPLALLFATSAFATSGCEAVLIPSVESIHEDNRKFEAFMFLNAAEEYDRLHELQEGIRKADATFLAFSAEYGDSNRREVFREKVQKKLQQTSGIKNEIDARSMLRTGVSDTQVKEWGRCMQNAGDAGGVLLTTTDQPSSNGYLLTLTRRLGAGPHDAPLRLNVENGTIATIPVASRPPFSPHYCTANSKRCVDETVQSSGDITYSIKGKPGATVRVYVNFAEGFSDYFRTTLPGLCDGSQIDIAGSSFGGGSQNVKAEGGDVVGTDTTAVPVARYLVEINPACQYRGLLFEYRNPDTTSVAISIAAEGKPQNNVHGYGLSNGPTKDYVLSQTYPITTTFLPVGTKKALLVLRRDNSTNGVAIGPHILPHISRISLVP
jgi:hypothetical protein